MLDLIQRIARHLKPARPILIGLVACGVLTAAVGLFAFAGSEGDALLMPGLLVLVWAVTAIVFIDVFAHIRRIPRPDRESHPDFWSDSQHRLREGFQWLLVLGFLVLSLTAADLSLHIADTWLLEPEK